MVLDQLVRTGTLPTIGAMWTVQAVHVVRPGWPEMVSLTSSRDGMVKANNYLEGR